MVDLLKHGVTKLQGKRSCETEPGLACELQFQIGSNMNGDHLQSVT